MLNSPLVVCAALVSIAAAAAFYLELIPIWKRIRSESARLRESGELAPAPTDAAHSSMMRIARFLSRLFIGPITIVGRENLAELPGPFILTSNHSHPLDLVTLNILLDRKARHPGAKGVLKLLGGFVAYVASKWGMFSVDLDKGKSAAAYKAMVKVLESGEIVYLFAEGWTHMTGLVHEFKTGTVRSAREASQVLGQTVPIVPVYIRYGWYPDESILKYHVAVQWLLTGFRFRGGASVVVGKPIDPLTLEEDPKLASARLRATVIGLDPGKSA